MTATSDDNADLAGQPDEPAAIPDGAWFSVAGTSDPAVLSPEAFAQGGAADQMGPGALLAALAEGACDPAGLALVSDNALLGVAGASRRLAARAAAITQRAVAEYARRHHAQDRQRSSPAGYAEFSPDELAPELAVNPGQAEYAMLRHEGDQRRLPACSQALWDGLLGEYPLKIIADQTACLDDAGAAEADQILAGAAPGLTPGQLRATAARVVLMIDPDAAEERRRDAATRARVIRYREEAGTGALCGRDLPPDAVLRSWQHIDGAALALKASGIKAGLDKLRAAVYLALTSGTSPLAVLPLLQDHPGEQLTPENATHDTSTADGTDWPQDEPWHAQTQPPPDGTAGHDNSTPRDGGTAGGSSTAGDDGSDGDEDARNSDGDADEDGEGGDEDAGGGIGPSGPGSSGPGSSGPGSSGPGSSGPVVGAVAPFQAVINLMVPVGTGFGWSSTPGEIPGWGPLDPESTRDMMAAASRHPSTRWCVTVVAEDGTAAAHGCAPGRHPWAPPSARDPGQRRTGDGERDSPSPARNRGPGPPVPGAADPGGDERDAPGQARNRRPGPPVPGAADPGGGARDGPGPAPGGQQEPRAGDPRQQAADFLASLRVRLAPVAKGTCDHDQCTGKYEVPRTLKHLIAARTATCTAPCCNRSAPGGDADHTVPWPEGPTCQANLGPVCRHHHRSKQDPGWLLEQPEPGIFRWTGPSGRVRTTYPTRYRI